jgi:hypothetical protein
VLLVGNPFPATIDFEAFYAENSAYIKRGYSLWTGSSFETYANALGYASTTGALSQYLPAGQGFMIELAQDVDAATLVFRPNITVQRTRTASGKLRNTDDSAPEVLTIRAGKADESKQTILAAAESGSAVVGNHDLSKIITSFASCPDVYTLKLQTTGQTQGLSINLLPMEGSFVTPIAVASTARGEMNLHLEGMNRFEREIIFVDEIEDRAINISGKDSFDYAFDFVPPVDESGNIIACENRFFLRIHEKSATALPARPAEELQIYAFRSGGQLQIESNETIRAIEVYNPQGQIVYRRRQLQALSHTMPLPAGLHILQIATDKGIKQLKIR